MRSCEVPECGRPYVALGKCRTHYNQEYAKRPRGQCTYGNCQRKRAKWSLCQTHYHRRRLGKSMDAPIRQMGIGHLSTEGYKNVRAVHPNARKSGYALEHRLLAARQVGRPLRRDETVHHRNGVRSDNSVGPCLTHSGCSCPEGPHNLELWSSSQPPGQRVEDKLEWARWILREYEG